VTCCRAPRLRDRSVLDQGVLGVASELTWDTEAFAIATGYDSQTGRYLGLAIPHQDVIAQVTDRTLLVHPDLAVLQREEEVAERTGAATSAGLGGASEVPGAERDRTASAAGGLAGKPEASPAPTRPRNTRFFGVAQINPERYARELTRLSQEIIQHLAAPEGVELEIRVEIAARKPDGYPDDKVRNVTENARTLKFETYGFEDR
jgi:hypothetical protein